MSERIFIVEDDYNIQQIMQFSLENCGYEVETFENPLDYFHRVKTVKPDLVIFDLMLPHMDGMTAIKKIRETDDYLPILIISAKDSEIDKVHGLNGGSDDYMSKPFGILELCARVRALLRRRTPKEKIVKTKSLLIDREKHIITKDGISIDFTNKEYQILIYLVDNKERVISRNELLDRIWGETFSGESRALDAQIKAIRQKLSDDGMTYIQTIRSVGYRFIEE